MRSSESMRLYPPTLAVDGDPRSCFYSHRSPPKWLQIDMGSSKSLTSVAITLPERSPSLAEQQQQQRRQKHPNQAAASE